VLWTADPYTDVIPGSNDTYTIMAASDAFTALGTVALVGVFAVSCVAGKACAFQLVAMGQYFVEKTKQTAKDVENMVESTAEKSQRELEKTSKMAAAVGENAAKGVQQKGFDSLKEIVAD